MADATASLSAYVTDCAFATLPDLVRRHAREQPSHVALIQEDGSGLQRIDYAALDARMDAVAARLQRDGIEPGDAVAICAPTSIEYAILFLAALRAGAVVAPLSPSSTPESLDRMRDDSGATLYFDERAVEDIMRWPAQWPKAIPATVDIGPDAPFNIIYSSGTTGTPKGIVQSHGMCCCARAR